MFLASPFPTQGSSARLSVWVPASSHRSCLGEHCHIPRDQGPQELLGASVCLSCACTATWH